MSYSEKNTSQYRPPVVTIMGHVDHGKTSILDAIRHANVTNSEFGGITQHIGAYQIIHNEHPITFVDTPGHAAFTQMRARGGKVADIVILVVAADDGVMPQTVEAIQHAKASGCPIIVAINKMDLPTADTAKVIQGLAENDVVVEAWGGTIPVVEVSAKTGKGLDTLLDLIQLTADMAGLKNNPDEELEGYIIESKKDNKRGVIVTAIIKNGTLAIGDKITASGLGAKVRSLMDDKGGTIKTAGPSTPVEISGFKDVPNVGDLILATGSELAELSLDTDRTEIIGQDTSKTVAIIVKADTQGTLEAVKASLAALVTSSVGATFSLKFIRTGTGDLTSSDVMLAQTLKGVIVGFNIKLPSFIKDQADSSGVPVKVYKTIYELVDDVKDLLEGSAVGEEAKIKGRARVLKVFKLPSGDLIAGCSILAGKVQPGKKVAIYAKDPNEITEIDTPLYRGVIKKLKHGKDDVERALKGEECGILLRPDFELIAKDQYIEII